MVEAIFEKGFDFRFETGGVKASRIGPTGCRVERMCHSLKLQNARSERVGSLLFEEKTGLSLEDRLQCSSVAKCQNGPTASLGLQRSNTKILDSRKKEGSAPPVMVSEHRKRLDTKESDSRPSHCFQSLSLRAFPYDNELPAEPRAGSNRDVHPLVRNQLRNGQVEIIRTPLLASKVFNIDRRMNDKRFPVIVSLNTS